MDKMTQRNRTVRGRPLASLLDVGYNSVGLDDNWQACGTGFLGTFHAANGEPLVNLDRFPNMSAMTAYGHSKGLEVGFYMNNCICHETGITNTTFIDLIYRASAKAVATYGYDGVKIDSCSQFHNTTYWAELLAATGRNITVENCHNTHQPDNISDWGGTCPFNWYRTSSDIQSNWKSVFSNLQTVTKYNAVDPPLSHPGCWAYPDMLEVGNLATYEESRAHFGAWCIVSSPLILGLDLTDEDRVSSIWDIITNSDAIAVNQNWAGHPGTLVKSIPVPSSPVLPTPGSGVYAVPCDATDGTQVGWYYDNTTMAVLSPTRKCLDGSTTDLSVQDCTQSSEQQFTFPAGAAAPICRKDQATRCVDVYNSVGPVVQLFDYHGGDNEKFYVVNETLRAVSGLCLANRADTPPGPNDGSTQIWAKPQPNDRMAVLVLTNMDSSRQSNQTFTIEFTDVGLNGEHEVYDIWTQRSLGSFTDRFVTDSFGGHDSRFYLLK
eukprot:TRINITY_DN9194_c0_g1_i1.p1 TRINITY_DN9194_c0_g1~~TRINITY_DN9194_c0_g1_i1.p1  ORF type:complete len:557 (+),score=83.14 TRINITY_DN9194_c0_g1_i1:198-1673(+)